MKKIFILSALTVFLFASCKKTTTPTEAKIRFVNMSPNSTGLDLYINAKLLVGGVGYGASSSYTAGTVTGALVSITAANGTVALVSGSLSLPVNGHYSIVTFDSTNNLQASIITDDKTAPAAGKANIRFLNLIKGSSSIDIKRGGTTNIYTGRTYNDHTANTNLSKYTTVDAGPFSVAAVVGGTSVVVAQLTNFEATAGKSYTLILRGVNTVSSGTQAPALVSLTDN